MINVATYSNRLINYFSNEVQHPNTIKLFRKCVYMFLIINGLILLPIADQIWSPETYLIHYHPFQNFLLKFLNVMSRPSVNEYYLVFVIGQILFAITGLIGFIPRISAIMVYFFTANLYYSAASIQTGGTNLMMLLLLYMIFVDENPSKTRNPKRETLNITISNFAFLACMVQVCIVYFVSAVYKLQGSHWLDGSAIYYVLNVDTYTTPFLKEHIASRDWITIPLTYFTLGFQLIFPFFVWIKKLKPVTLTLGIILHVCIGWMLGLMDFSVIMIIAYVLFFSHEFSIRLLNKFRYNKL